MTQEKKGTTPRTHYKGDHEAPGQQNLGKQNPQDRSDKEPNSTHQNGNKGKPAPGENRTVQSPHEQGRQGSKTK